MNDDELKELFRSIKTIAVVGVSNNQEKAAYGVAKYLKQRGYRIIPVNPGCDEVLGEKCYSAIEEIPDEIDAVDVFRKAEFVPETAKAAVKKGAKVLWLQDSIISPEAQKIAEEAGMKFIQNDCMFRRHVGIFGFGNAK
ncbi:CoA-binding protein [bacterium]|nr:CoA-binding protein [FCB group bacterium]MBL7190762.1 CoA-binding protein [bacterium]